MTNFAPQKISLTFPFGRKANCFEKCLKSVVSGLCIGVTLVYLPLQVEILHAELLQSLWAVQLHKCRKRDDDQCGADRCHHHRGLHRRKAGDTRQETSVKRNCLRTRPSPSRSKDLLPVATELSSSCRQANVTRGKIIVTSRHAEPLFTPKLCGASCSIDFQIVFRRIEQFQCYFRNAHNFYIHLH